MGEIVQKPGEIKLLEQDSTALLVSPGPTWKYPIWCLRSRVKGEKLTTDKKEIYARPCGYLVVVRKIL